GPKGIGKTTLIKNYLKQVPKKSYLHLDCSDSVDLKLLQNERSDTFKRIFSSVQQVIIENIILLPSFETVLFTITNLHPGLQVIISGNTLEICQKLKKSKLNFKGCFLISRKMKSSIS